jgi:hypothetical protein
MYHYSRGQGGGLFGEVRMDGQAVMRIPMNRDGDYVLPHHPAVRFRVAGDAVAFSQSDCPDYICVNTGFLNKPGQMAVCLPNRVSLAVTGETAIDGFDAFTFR